MNKTNRIAPLILIPTLGVAALISKAEPPSYAEESAQADLDNKQSAIDRPIYVTPAPKRFKAQGKGPRLKMRLVLEKSKIHKGDPIRYRLEITSVGTEPYLFGEFSSSFFKTGRVPSDAFILLIKDSSGKTQSAHSPRLGHTDILLNEIEFPPGLSEEDKAARVKKMGREKSASGTVLQRLAPGETLHTLGDAPGDNLRTLPLESYFTTVGAREFTMVFRAFSKYEVKSNSVMLTIEP